MPRQLYFGSGTASRRTTRNGETHIDTYAMGLCVIARNQAEADGLAMQALKARVPRETSYANHDLRVDPMSRADVQAWLDAYDEAD